MLVPWGGPGGERKMQNLEEIRASGQKNLQKAAIWQNAKKKSSKNLQKASGQMQNLGMQYGRGQEVDPSVRPKKTSKKRNAANMGNMIGVPGRSQVFEGILCFCRFFIVFFDAV